MSESAPHLFPLDSLHILYICTFPEPKKEKNSVSHTASSSNPRGFPKQIKKVKEAQRRITRFSPCVQLGIFYAHLPYYVPTAMQGGLKRLKHNMSSSSFLGSGNFPFLFFFFFPTNECMYLCTEYRYIHTYRHTYIIYIYTYTT